MSTLKSLAAERIKQKKLYKIRILLFGCRKDLLKDALSGDSLVCTPKSSQLMDGSSSCSSDIDRIPAGSSPCGCQTGSGTGLNSARSSTLDHSTRDVSTQTEDYDTKSLNETGSGALTQPGPNRKDIGTQLSFSELSNNSSRAFIQVQYSNVSKKFPPSCNILGEEDEPQSETASLCEELSHKFFRRPRVLVDGSRSNISGASSHLPKSPPGSQPTRSQPQRGQAIRNQPPRGQQPKKDNKSSRSKQKPVKRQSAVAFEPPKRNRQYEYGEQVPPAFPGAPTTNSEEQSRGRQTKQDQQTQCEDHGNRASASMPCSRIPELLERVCQVEAKLRQQERTLRGLQCSMKSSKPSKCPPSQPVCCKPKPIDQCTQKSNCSLPSAANSCKPSTTINQPPKECSVPSKPACKCSTSTVNQPPKECCEPPKPACPPQCPPKCEEKKPDCKALKKEFIDIFTRKDPTECSAKDCEKPIKICPTNNNNCIDGRKMCLQCLEKSDVLMHQFNHMFVNPGNQGFNYIPNKAKKNKTPSLEQFEQPESEAEIQSETDVASCLSIPTKQCLTGRESRIENILDKCVDLVATKSKGNVSNIEMVSSDSWLTKKNAPKTFDSRQCLQKEVYESLMEQFVKYFTKPKTECGLNPLPTQRTEGENYSFERLCVELISLISKTKNLELSAVINEDKLTDSNKVPQKDQAECQDNCISIQKPCKVEYVSNDPPVSPGGCQSCSDNGNLRILDSLVDEMSNLIGSRPFQHVVLTIMRRGCNVYHVNIRERSTGKVLGCLLANGAAVNEAISLGLFEDIPTFCELNRQRADDPRDCPCDAQAPQREPGGETLLAKRDKARAMEFVTRVLGLPVGEAERFFSLTSALKTAKNSSDQSLGGAELSRVTKSSGLIGRGAVTDNLLYLGTTGSQLDVSELGEASKHFLRLLSGLDTEDNDKP